MTPGRAFASGVHPSDSCVGEDDSCIGDSDLFWGCGTEGGSASVSTSRWGDVAVVQQDALESPLAQYSPGYDASPLSPSLLFKEFPRGIDWDAVPPVDTDQILFSAAGAISPPADIDQVSVSEAGVISFPGDIHQLSVDESAPSPEPARRLSRKRSRGAKQTEALAAPKKPADRTVQIAGFSWTLPPDPGKRGPYPNLTFLIGAAISSSASGAMELAEIRQWIKERYPSWQVSRDNSISSMLAKQTDFINIRKDVRRRGLWGVRNPQQLKGYYEKDIFLLQRSGIANRDRALRHPVPASERSRGAASPGLSVRFGSHVLTLAPYRAGQKKPPIRLLCGCAIALGSEQGAGVKEITEWIADRYFIQQANAIKALTKRIKTALGTPENGFRRTNNPEPRKPKRGFPGMRWVLKNPADFAARYGGYICSQDS